MRRFETGGPRRFVWDPAVHAKYGEDCYFYLLRAADAASHVALTDELNRLLRREDISSHSIYATFGYYDALVRLWATETVRRRFLRALLAARVAPAELLEFRATSITYSFASTARQLSEGEVRGHERQIKAVVESEAQDLWDTSRAADGDFDVLVKESFIHEVPTSPGIKVYLVLARAHARMGPQYHDEPAQIVRAMENAGFASVCLSSGYGRLGHYLAKGVFDQEFAQLWGAVTAVHEVCSSMQLRSMTLPIANLDSVVEADNVDNLRTIDAPVMDELIREITELYASTDDEQERLRRYLAELTTPQQESLFKYYREVADGFRDSPLFRRLIGIIRSSLLYDPDGIIAELAFITYIERDLRRALPRLLRDSLGEHWYASVDELLKAASAIEPADASSDELDRDEVARGVLAKLSLHDLFSLTRRLASQDQAVGDALTAGLGAGWTEQTRLIEELRNDFAHGRLVDRGYFTDFDEAWGDQLGRILIAARYAEGLRDLRGPDT